MFSGDVLDGVGIYPGQLDELAMDSIHDQYDAFGSFLERIPEDVQMVVIPGNHDMVQSPNQKSQKDMLQHYQKWKMYIYYLIPLKSLYMESTLYFIIVHPYLI